MPPPSSEGGFSLLLLFLALLGFLPGLDTLLNLFLIGFEIGDALYFHQLEDLGLLLGLDAHGAFLGQGGQAEGQPLFGAGIEIVIQGLFKIDELAAKESLYQDRIMQDTVFIDNLNNNDEFLVQFAREKFFMHGKDEQVIIVE